MSEGLEDKRGEWACSQDVPGAASQDAGPEGAPYSAPHPISAMCLTISAMWAEGLEKMAEREQCPWTIQT